MKCLIQTLFKFDSELRGLSIGVLNNTCTSFVAYFSQFVSKNLSVVNGITVAREISLIWD